MIGAGQVVLIGGGVRSGKSTFALQRARALGKRRVFFATARAGDEEMATRIENHRRERGREFVTVEAPLDLTGALRGAGDFDVAVVDCVTLWLSNLLLRGDAPEAILEQCRDLAKLAQGLSYPLVLVTNEVGMGVVPESKLGRTFRDLAGSAHQILAGSADEIHLAALGVILRLRPGPVMLINDREHNREEPPKNETINEERETP